MGAIDALVFGVRNLQVAGVPIPTETTINFVSGATAVDNPGLGRTDITITPGSGGSTSTASFGVDDPVLSYKQPRFVTTDATPVDCSVTQWTMPDLTAADVIVKVVGKQAASALFFAGDFRIRVTRNGGAPVFGTLIAGSNQVALGAAAVTITNPSGNLVSPHVVGVGLTNITWSVTMTVQPVTSAT